MNNYNENSMIDLEKVVRTDIDFPKVVESLVSTHNIIFSGNTFYLYANGYFRLCEDKTIEKKIWELLGEKISSYAIREVIALLKIKTDIPITELNCGDIFNLKNCIVEILPSGGVQTYEHLPELLSTRRFDIEYNPEAKCENWIKVVNEILEDDENKVNLLQEYFGLCLTRDMRQEKALFLLGEGANGKSVMLFVLQELLGESNYSTLSVGNFKEKHALECLVGKLANISTETTANGIIEDSNFKAIVSGDAIYIEPKFKKGFSYRPFCKLIFALNTMPKTNDRTDAFFRRMLIVKFNKQFPDFEQDKTLKYALLNELDGIFNWCLGGLLRLRERGGFYISKEMQDEIFEFKKDNNTVLGFLEEDCRYDSAGVISKSELYKAYQAWCGDNGSYALGKNNFGKEIKKLKNVTDGKDSNERIWIGIKWRERTIITNKEM